MFRIGIPCFSSLIKQRCSLFNVSAIFRTIDLMFAGNTSSDVTENFKRVVHLQRKKFPSAKRTQSFQGNEINYSSKYRKPHFMQYDRSNLLKFNIDNEIVSNENQNSGLPRINPHSEDKLKKYRSHRNKEADQFGLLSSDIDGDAKNEELDEKFKDEEDEPHRRLSEKHDRRYPPHWYGKKMEEYGECGKIREAIDVLEVWMLKNDRVMPNTYCFNVLIGILGRCGFTKKCFQLFNQMKKMGLKADEHTYTGLFNACSNSPWKDDGLSRATKLHDLIKSCGYLPNLLNYHAMLKAYAICGDVRAALSTMDELRERYQPRVETFSFLLMACCSDSNVGFLFTLRVWKLMLAFKVVPGLHHYNLLLRAIRDCSMGNSVDIGTLFLKDNIDDNVDVTSGPTTDEMRSRGTSRAKLRRSKEIRNIRTVDSYVNCREYEYAQYDRSNVKLIPREHDTTLRESRIIQTKNCNLESVVSNTGILSNLNSFGQNNFIDFTNNSAVVAKAIDSVETTFNQIKADPSQNSFADLAYPRGRLELIGGLRGFIETMKSSGCSPDIKTFTLLVDVLGGRTEDEDSLMDLMEENNVKKDVDFYNLIIEKRNKRRDRDAAMAVLKIISKSKLVPNIKTFGCLSLGCNKISQGRQLLQEMDQCGLSPNVEIFEILVRRSYHDFYYLQFLLNTIQNEGITPTTKLISLVENAIYTARQCIVKMERGGRGNSFYASDYFKRGYYSFEKFYERWLHETNWKEPPHPWQGFRRSLPDDNVDK